MRGRVDVATGAASFVCRNSVYQMTQHRWSSEPARIDIHAEHELRYWSERFGVPKDDIEAAVKRVGPRVEDVAQEVSLLYA
jgi:Protein of unknown function (DUF3606)